MCGNIFFVTFGPFSLGFAEEEMHVVDLEIKSKTVLVSPQSLLEEIPEDVDKERECIGIGERVNLSLEGKLLSDVDSESIEWKIKNGEKIVKLEVDKEDKKKAELIADSTVLEGGEVTITVKTNVKDDDLEKSFEVIVPNDIKAMHSGVRVPGFPIDGRKTNHLIGASSRLTLIFFPIKVSFAGLIVKEEAEDQKGDIPEGLPAHIPRPAAKLGKMNDLSFDDIACGGGDVNLWQGGLVPDFFYKCGIFVNVDNVNHCKIGGKEHFFPQKIKMRYDGVRDKKQGTQEVKVSVSKFNCTVSRSTAGEANHQDEEAPIDLK